MIDSITIRGFRSIVSIEELKLHPLNVVIGANGSGKSNFIEAFKLLWKVAEGRVDDLDAGILHLGATEIVVEMVSQATNKDGIGGSTCRLRLAAVGDHFELAHWFVANPAVFRAVAGDDMPSALIRLRDHHPASYKAIRLMTRRVAPFFDDFVLESLSSVAWRHTGSDQVLSLSALSEGTVRFLALAALLLQPVELRPRIILIDQPELGLHPVAIAIVGAMIRMASKDSQIIIATQSPRLLDEFDPHDVLVAEREGMATQIQRLDPKPLRPWLEDYSLGQLWEKNVIGGRP